MGIRTGVIRFNVKDRGRRFRGQDRNFDTAALAALINGGEVQERVKNGDMLGYWGHWPRVKFGLDVSEGTIVGGKQVNIEPAVRTTHLKAYPDGTIEHESEFLDTAPGRLAGRVWASKAGGWSSAINAPRRGSMQVPSSFHGFDYVLEPNYTANRGYAMDSAGNRIDPDGMDEADQMVLDEVGQYNALMESTTALLDRQQADYDRLAETLDSVLSENHDLRGALAKVPREAKDKNPVPPAPKQSRAQVLDAVKQTAISAADSRFAEADDFKRASLEGIEDVTPSRAEEPKSAAETWLQKRFGSR